MFEEIIENIEEKAKEAIKQKDGDYIKDDLLYCGKCNTPKQAKVVMFGKIITPYCLCKCESERLKAEEKARKTEKRRIEAFGSSNLVNCTFEADDGGNPKITEAMKRYVENFTDFKKSGQGLLLYGDTGRGKTFAAAEVANALIDKGYSVYVTNFAKIANEITASFDDKQEVYDRLSRYSLLVLDDLSAERKTEFMQEVVHAVIDSRINSGKPMIITTNLTADELSNPQDIASKRIYERITQKCLPIKVEGQNRRKEELTQNFNKLNEILGL